MEENRVKGSTSDRIIKVSTEEVAYSYAYLKRVRVSIKEFKEVGMQMRSDLERSAIGTCSILNWPHSFRKPSFILQQSKEIPRVLPPPPPPSWIEVGLGISITLKGGEASEGRRDIGIGIGIPTHPKVRREPPVGKRRIM